MHYPATTRIDSRCVSPRAPCCAAAHGGASTTTLRRRFEELRGLCAQAGDKASLAVGMAGMVIENMHHARIGEASRLASECMALVESIGEPTLIVELSFAACVAKLQAAEWDDALRWSQRVIDLADRYPANANILVGSPVAVAFVFCGVARWRLGRGGWREDFDRAVSMTRMIDSVSHALVIGYKYDRNSSPAYYRPTTPRSPKSTTRCRSPSDPVTTSHGPWSGWRWARCWCRTIPQTDVDEDLRCSPSSSTCASRSASH